MLVQKVSEDDFQENVPALVKNLLGASHLVRSPVYLLYRKVLLVIVMRASRHADEFLTI